MQWYMPHLIIVLFAIHRSVHRDNLVRYKPGKRLQLLLLSYPEAGEQFARGNQPPDPTKPRKRVFDLGFSLRA